MNRRVFIKSTLTSALLGAAAITLPFLRGSASPDPSRLYLKSPTLGRSFQGTVDGRLYESLDGGRSWRQAFNFGSQVAVLALVERQGSLAATLGIDAYTFTLTSPDGYTWSSLAQAVTDERVPA